MDGFPSGDARLADGSRVNVIIPPLSLKGPSISIRKFSQKILSLKHLAAAGSLSPELATTLEIFARSRLNIIVSGGTGSGKTTLLNALSGMIDPGERIITIEDAAELQLQRKHVIQLETRPANLEGRGRIDQGGLVRNALRMRPDRIIVGEVRGGEAFDMMQAMNTGHDGSMSTVHSNSARDALARLENMVLMGNVEVPAGVAMKMIWALKIPSTCLLISNASLAGARDLARWSEMIGRDTPERHTLQIVNHVAPHGGLKEADFARASGRSPDLTMAYSRELAEAAPLGIKAMQKGASFKRNLAPLLSEFTGETQAKKGSLLSKFFKASREPRDQAETADAIAAQSKARVKPVFISK